MIIFALSIALWVLLGGPKIAIGLQTTQLLIIGLFISGIVVSFEELLQAGTVSGVGLFPLIISLAMVLNPRGDYGLLLVSGLFLPLVFLIGKSKGESIGRKIFAGIVTVLFFMTLFLLSGIVAPDDRATVFAIGAVLLSFAPFAVRLGSIDLDESAWKGLVIHQAVLRISVIILSPALAVTDDGATLRSLIFWITLACAGVLLLNTWVRRQQRVWDCAFQSLLSLFVVNFASLGTISPMDWMVGATLASMTMSLVPTKRPATNQDFFSQTMIALENGALAGSVFLFLLGAVVSTHAEISVEMTMAQAITAIWIGVTGWIFVPKVTRSQSYGLRATPKSVFQALSILGALILAGYKYVDAVARRIDV